jgi:hypothetical protein
VRTAPRDPRAEGLWGLSLVVGVVAIWVAVVLIPSPAIRPEFGNGDLFSYFLPAYQFVGERLRGGHLAWWNPYTGGGVPLAATLQPGALYPARLLLLAFDADRATHVSLVAHLVVATLAMAGLARAWGASRWGATAAAAVFVVPAELPHLYFPSYLEAGAWLPVAGLAITRVLDGGPIGWSAVLGLALGLPVVAGGYQTAPMVVYGSAVVLAAYLVGGGRGMAWGACATRLAVAGLVAVAVAAPQLGLTLAWTTETARPASQLTEAQIQPWWTPANRGLLAREVLRQTIVSNGGLQTLYLSAPAVVLILVGFLRGGRRGLVLGTAWLFFYLLTFGPDFPGFAVYRWLPGIAWFRLPQRLAFLVAFLGAIAVGLGTTRARGATGPRATRWWDAGTAVVVLLALVLPARNTRAIPWTLPSALRVYGPDVFKAAAGAVGEGRVSMQTVSLSLGSSAFPRLALEEHVRMLEDYEPLSSRRLQTLLRAIAGEDGPLPPDAPMFTGTVESGAVARPHLLDVAAVTAIVTAGVPASVAAWRPASRLGTFAVLRNPNPLPRAHLARRTRFVGSDADALALLSAGAHDPHAAALLVGAPDEHGDGDASVAAIMPLDVAEDSPERVRVSLPPGSGGAVVLADAWAPGWSASIDGEPRRLYQANYFGRGVLVGPGDRSVMFVYDPPGLRPGLWIALGAASTAVSLAWIATRRPRARDRGQGGRASV